MYWQAILQGGLWLRWVALAIFIAAAITDFFDGYLARTWDQQSKLGRMLDPIADKLLVASCLLMLAADETIKGWSLFAAIIILCREILVSGLREYLAELRVSVPVTQLAKWKTTMQLVAIGFLLCGEAGDTVLPQSVLAWRWKSGEDADPAGQQRRPGAALDFGLAHALYRLGLFPRRHAASDRGLTVKLLYFAWVRERVGKTDEEISPPADVRTVAELMEWLAGRGEEYAYAFENRKVIRAAIDRNHVRPGHRDRRTRAKSHSFRR